MHSTRAVRSLRIHCPVDRETLLALSAGHIPMPETGSTLAEILDIVRREEALGDFGLYKSVVEMVAGWEIFTPTSDAKPTLGKANATSISPTAILTIYIAEEASPKAVSRAIDAIMTAHPWEVPVIEISHAMVVERA